MTQELDIITFRNMVDFAFPLCGPCRFGDLCDKGDASFYNLIVGSSSAIKFELNYNETNKEVILKCYVPCEYRENLKWTEFNLPRQTQKFKVDIIMPTF